MDEEDKPNGVMVPRTIAARLVVGLLLPRNGSHTRQPRSSRLPLQQQPARLRTGYPGTIGVKTGFTDAAGRCLVAAAQRGGRRLGVVLLHSPDPGRQARVLLDRGFRRVGR